jgi:hypothetical protein
MALPQVQSYRAGVANAPSAATPRVSFGQPTRADLAVQAEVQYQNTMGQVLDRISSRLFKVAETQSAREGLQFAIDNPMTPEQLQAMSRGEMPADLDLGNPLNVFNNAVRKARAIEVSAHFEMEDTQKLLEIADAADRGMISTEDAKNKISSLINASAQVQANIDPDASYKYRATMANYGSRMVDYISKKEIEKNRVANTFKVDTDYSNKLGIIAKALESPLGINPETNAQWDVAAYLNSSVGNFVNNASSVVGAAEAAKYGQRMRGDIENLMVSAVNRELINPKYLANTADTFKRIATGDIDNVKQVAGYLMINKPQAMTTIASNFRSMISDDITRKNQEEATRKRRVDEETTIGMVEYFDAQTPPQRKRQIVMEIARSGGFTIAQMEQFLDPRRKEGDPFVVSDIKTQIVNGDITTTDQLKSIAVRAGLNGKDYASLNDTLLQGFNEERKAAERYRRRVAGIPDIQNSFATKDQMHLIEKDNKIREKADRMANDFRVTNPGQLVPWMSITEQAITEYRNTEQADAEKQQAVKQLNDFVSDELKKKGIVNSEFAITAETNIEDLVARGILKKSEDIEYVRKRIQTLRRVSQ